MTITAITHADVVAIDEPARRIDVLRAEWTKLRSIRSTWWTLTAVLAGVVGVSLLVCAADVARWDSTSTATRANFDATSVSLTGLALGQVLIGVLGVLAISSEYATGTIRATFAAVPTRVPVLRAKVLALVAPAFVVSTLASFGAFLGGQAILAQKHAGVSLLHANELRAVLGGGVFLTLLALFGLGLGTIFRHTAGAITAFIGIVLVSPSLVAPLPNPWGRDIAQYLPAIAGQSMVVVHHTAKATELSPGAGFAVLCAWAALALGVGAWLIARRDA